MRRKFSQRKVAATSRRRSTFLSAVKQSRKSISFLMPLVSGSPPKSSSSVDEGNLDEEADDMDEPDEAISAVLAAKSKSSYHKAEAVSRNVAKTLDRYYARLRAQSRALPLGERLDAVVRFKEESAAHHRKKLTAGVSVDLPASTGNALQDWNNFQQAVQAAKHPDPTEILEKTLQEASNDIGEYLENTPIYYGATLALQARHGGYLSYANGDIKASAHKVLSQCRFIVKKSDDLTDIGAVKFGDALWLQTVSNGSIAPSVLGAVYGSLIDKKREIQPALVSCKRSVMFKAQQYGRWIILNRDDPMGTLGKAVGHLDRIILEQEWCFLASNSPYSSSMFRICQNSDDALARKIDLFKPGEECIWRLHLVALPSDDGEYEKQRQQRLQEAKDQIDASEELRLSKSNFLLSSLNSFLPDNLRDDNYIKDKMQHKATAASEQDYLLTKYRDMESRDFRPTRESVEFLARVYGPESSIVAYRREAHRINNREYDTSSKSSRRATSVGRSLSPTDKHSGTRSKKSVMFADGNDTTGSNPAPQTLRDDLTPWQELHQVSRQTQKLENAYWDTAQRLLVDSRSYELLPAVMEEFMDKDRARKQRATRVIQAFVRRCLDRKFNFHRQFRRIDKQTRSRLEAKLMLKRRLLLDAGSGGDITGKIPDSTLLTDAVQSATVTGDVNHNVLWKAINRFKEAGAAHAAQHRQSANIYEQEMQAQQKQLQQDIAEQHAKIIQAEEMEVKKQQQQQETQALHQQQHDAIAKLRRANSTNPKAFLGKNKPPLVRANTSVFTTQMNLDGSKVQSTNAPAATTSLPPSAHQQQVAFFQEQYERYLRKKQHQLLARKASFIAMPPSALSSEIPSQQTFFSQALFEHVHAQLMQQQTMTPQQLQQQQQHQQFLQQQVMVATGNGSAIDANIAQTSFGVGLHHQSVSTVSFHTNPTPMRRTFNSIDSQLYPSAVIRHAHPADHIDLAQEAQMPLTTNRLLYDPSLIRPASAPSKYEIAVTHEDNPRLSKLETMRESQYLKEALGAKPDRKYGLPDDVFEDIKGPTSFKTGVKFLKAMSKNQTKSMPSIPAVKSSGEDLFGDLKVKKKRHHKHHHSSNTVEKKERPHSSNAALRRRAVDRVL